MPSDEFNLIKTDLSMGESVPPVHTMTYDRPHLFWRNASSVLARNRPAGDFSVQNEFRCRAFSRRRRYVDTCRICCSSLCAAWFLTNPTRASSCQPRRGSPHYFLANMGLFRANLFDRRRRLPCGRLICLFMVPIRASLRSSLSRYVAVTTASAPPKSSSIRNEKLRCQHNAVGSHIWDDVAPMTRETGRTPPRAKLG